MNNLFLGTIILFCVFIIGVSTSQLYNLYHPYIYNNVTTIKINECFTQAKIAGLWLPNISRLSEYNGQYICININEVKTLRQLQKTCMHETSHEIFAREMENNPDRFWEVIGIIENETL